jgi:L-rhamnose mutarotase
MNVNPDMEEEYQRRHSPIWPELKQVIKSHGGHNYSIFWHHQTNQLFAYVEIEDETRWAAIAQTEACKKWWSYMKDIMKYNDDGTPFAIEIKETFHLK